MLNGLCKSRKNKFFFGVCGGIAEYFKIDPLIIRIAFILIPGGAAVYLILVLFLPDYDHFRD
jgi:phage shock protein C